jgi:hypothetical protein
MEVVAREIKMLFPGNKGKEVEVIDAKWFDTFITRNDKKLRLSWLGYLPLAHAYTLYIAYCLKSDPKTAKLKRKDLLLWA